MNYAHLHLILVHIPIVLFPIVLLLFLVNRRWSSPPVEFISHLLLIFAAVSAVSAYLTGEEAEELVEHLRGVKESLIDRHAESALWALWAVIVTASISIWELLRIRWSIVKAPPKILLNGAIAITSIVLIWVGFQGGKIRHPEIVSSGSQENVIPGGESHK